MEKSEISLRPKIKLWTISSTPNHATRLPGGLIFKGYEGSGRFTCLISFSQEGTWILQFLEVEDVLFENLKAN